MCEVPPVVVNVNNEAYKAIIDLNKTIISIGSAILAGLIAYLIFQDSLFEIKNYIGLLFIILSIIFSIAGFGKAIQTLSDGISRNKTILLTNISVYLLIFGIVLLLLIKFGNEKNLDQILKEIEKTSTLQIGNLSKTNCNEILKEGKTYKFIYLINNQKVETIYSIESNKIISIKKIPENKR